MVIDTDSIGSCKSTTTTVPYISYCFDYYIRCVCVCVFFFFYLFLMEQNVIASFRQYWQCRNIHVRIQIFFSFSFVVIKIGYIRFNKCGFSENGIWFWDFHSVKKTIYSSNRNNVKISTVLQWNNFLLHRRYHTVWYQFAIFKYHQTVIQLYSFYYVTLLE
jgi:hypothetical protein